MTIRFRHFLYALELVFLGAFLSYLIEGYNFGVLGSSGYASRHFSNGEYIDAYLLMIDGDRGPYEDNLSWHYTFDHNDYVFSDSHNISDSLVGYYTNRNKDLIMVTKNMDSTIYYRPAIISDDEIIAEALSSDDIPDFSTYMYINLQNEDQLMFILWHGVARSLFLLIINGGIIGLILLWRIIKKIRARKQLEEPQTNCQK